MVGKTSSSEHCQVLPGLVDTDPQLQLQEHGGGLMAAPGPLQTGALDFLMIIQVSKLIQKKHK